MNLRAWLSNNDKVNNSIALQDRAEMKETSVLGHTWNHQLDTFSIKQPNIVNENNGLTKRLILKVIASVFDPLGMISPTLLKVTLLLQDLWKQKLSWDDVIEDEEIKETWSEIRSDVSKISKFSFQRCLSMKHEEHITYTLLCFCDASLKSYATTVYLYQKSSSDVKVDLVFAKSRVAPVKTMSVPRLELMGVLIGVRCLKCVHEQLKLTGN
ncbi:uncharacterized protein LOC123536020 [Mercenaria mercenaria]|uniref:uncharacterized protein LOC123536020 n=1 Tax=Mercenaria mercenaria TaxID=6596 RepID=UPI00234F224C|nr:uncharacterized protein LOC123536020 [Mercenaria mercenaria]